MADALRAARQSLAGSPTASLDAHLLLGEVLQHGRAWLLAHGEERIEPFAFDRFWSLVHRRSEGEPVAYLRGRVDWLDLELEVSPAVLIPRPETEILAEHSIRLGRELGVRRVADIGTGSGALAIALARGLPRTVVVATDVSPVALEVAARNVGHYGLGDRITLLSGNLLEPLDEAPDLLVANLPYLSDVMMATLDRDVRSEPEFALRGGVSGLDLYVSLLDQLEQRSWHCPLFLEIDPRQSGAMLDLLSVLPAGASSLHPDLSGKNRIAQYLPKGRHVD